MRQRPRPTRDRYEQPSPMLIERLERDGVSTFEVVDGVVVETPVPVDVGITGGDDGDRPKDPS